MTSKLCLTLALALGLTACGKNEPTPDTLAPDAVVADTGGADKKVSDQGIPANSGRICTTVDQCAPGDECISLSYFGSKSKMCASSCTPGDACSVPSPAKNSSRCYLQVGSSYYCMWFCEYTGKTYQCPVDGAYDCITPNPKEPGMKICVPK